MATTVRLLSNHKISGIQYMAGDLVSVDDTTASQLVTGKIGDSTVAAINRALSEGELVKYPDIDAVREQNSFSRNSNILLLSDEFNLPDPSGLGVAQAKHAAAVSDGFVWYSSVDGYPLKRNIANRCRSSHIQLAGLKSVNSRAGFDNKSDLTQNYLSIEFAHWLAAETAPAGSTTYVISIEYPAGKFQILPVGGQDSFVISGIRKFATDWTTLNNPIPPNARAWVKVYAYNPSGVPLYANTYGLDAANWGDGMYYSATSGQLGGADGLGDALSPIGTNGGTFNSASIFPLAVVGLSNKPSFLGLGDSRFGGGYEQSGGINNGFCGHFERSIGPHFAFCNIALPGEGANGFTTASAQRQSLKDYCTAGVINYGINDIAGGRSVAQLKISYTTIAGLFPNLPLTPTTVEPLTASAGGQWVSAADQTIPDSGEETARLDWCTLVRAGGISALAPNFTSSFIDTASVLEIPADTNTPPSNPYGGGKWITNGGNKTFVWDGTHATPVGNQMVAASGVYLRGLGLSA